jgi:hypothetical protein
MFIEAFSDWLYATPVAAAIRQTIWIIPTLQSAHILSIAVIAGSALVSDLRLAGVLAADVPPSAIVRRYLPWMWWALVVLLLTGSLLIVAEPGRTLGNSIFWIKMGLVAFAFSLTLAFRRPLLDPGFALDQARWRAMVKPAAWLSLTIWVAVIFCGRWIAYT